MTTTFNLSTLETREYDLPPKQAVIAAHAQDHGDFDFARYETWYGPVVEHGERAVFCGDWAAIEKKKEIRS